MHEKRSFDIRYERNSWFRSLVEGMETIGDKTYKGLEGIMIVGKKELNKVRQMIETSIWGTKGFYYSLWRKRITLLTYLYGYALGFLY